MAGRGLTVSEKCLCSADLKRADLLETTLELHDEQNAGETKSITSEDRWSWWRETLLMGKNPGR